MKKKILLSAVAIALTLVSCDMDKEPYNAIPDDKALETPQDFKNMSVGLYSGLRACVGSPAFYNTLDVMGDEFNSVAGFSGSLAYMYNWSLNPSSGEAGVVYGNCQAIIARANFIIDGYSKCDMSNPTLFTPAAKAEVKNIKGEAFFSRAFSLFELAQYFCADYDESTADAANSGVSYRTDYYPSSNGGTYPARTTLRATYKQITDDLDSAALYISARGEQASYYVTADVVNAIRARVALAMDDYTNAAKYAVDVIKTNKYSLISNAAMMEDMWWGDFDSESIMKLSVTSTSDRAGQTGKIYLPYTTSSIPDYIPTKTLVDLYSDNDIRKGAYFMEIPVTTTAGISGLVYTLNKYTDQGYLYNQNQGDEYSRFMIEPKVVRISEMYLIAAEAYAQAGNITEAAKYLNDLEGKRIKNYTPQSFTGRDDIMSEIMNEREREFVGEGMRLLDIRRWGLDLRRGEPQQLNLCAVPGPTTTGLVKRKGDMRFVWPIPKHEIDANPQIVQNPGY